MEELFILASGLLLCNFYFGMAVYQEQPCADIAGFCLSTSQCPSTNQVSYKCPNQPSDVKCCTYNVNANENPCRDNGGTCQWSAYCSGSTKTGECPSQPGAVKCCYTAPSAGCSCSGGPSSGKLIYIDAGHGGSDPGAVAGGVNEKDLSLQIACKLRDQLLNNYNNKFRVVMTRCTDKFISLTGRADLANSAGAKVFISVHINSASSSSASGIETYYYPGSSSGSSLAGNVQANLIAKTGAKDRGKKTANFSVLRNTKMPAILVECGFISNDAERGNMVNSAYQQKLAEGIADGINQYI